MIKIELLILTLCILGIVNGFNFSILPFQNNCSNPELITALFQQSATLYGDNITAQINYIKSKIDRSKYPYWEVHIVKNQSNNSIGQQRNGGWPGDACYFTCAGCVKKMPTLTYELIGMQSFYSPKAIVDINSLKQVTGSNMTVVDLNIWKDAIGLAILKSSNLTMQAITICQYLFQIQPPYIVHTIVVDNSNTQFYGSFNQYISSKIGMYYVQKRDKTSYLIRFV